MPDSFQSNRHLQPSAAELSFPVKIHHAILHIVKMQQHFSCAVGCAGYSVIDHNGADIGAALDKAVNAVDETSASGHYYTVLIKVAYKLRWGALKHGMHCVEYAVHRFNKGFDELSGVYLNGFGQPVFEVLSFDLFNAYIGTLYNAADAALEFLSSAQSDADIIFLAYKFHDRLIKARACDLY